MTLVMLFLAPKSKLGILTYEDEEEEKVDNAIEGAT
jgi:hypothetical protein